MKLLPSLALVVLVGCHSRVDAVAPAQPVAPPSAPSRPVATAPARPSPATLPAPALSRGPVTMAELSPQVRERLAAADTDQDGELTAPELDAQRQRSMDTWRVSADADQDGQVTPEEYRAFRQQVRSDQRAAQTLVTSSGPLTKTALPEGRWAQLEHLDTDRDGTITPAEIRAHR